MAIALVTSAKFESTNTNGGNTTTVDTTGATLLVSSITDNNGTSTCSDSKGNTYAVARAAQGIGPQVKLWYIKNPVVGSGHFGTVGATGLSPVLYFHAFSGSDTASDVDQSNGASASFAATIQPGSITPSESNELLVTGVAGDTASGSINSGFTITYQTNLVGSAHFGGGAAYLVHTSGAINPQWSGGSYTGCVIASFKVNPIVDLNISVDPSNSAYRTKAMIVIT